MISWAILYLVPCRSLFSDSSQCISNFHSKILAWMGNYWVNKPWLSLQNFTFGYCVIWEKECAIEAPKLLLCHCCHWYILSCVVDFFINLLFKDHNCRLNLEWLYKLLCRFSFCGTPCAFTINIEVVSNVNCHQEVLLQVVM